MNLAALLKGLKRGAGSDFTSRMRGDFDGGTDVPYPFTKLNQGSSPESDSMDARFAAREFQEPDEMEGMALQRAIYDADEESGIRRRLSQPYEDLPFMDGSGFQTGREAEIEELLARLAELTGKRGF